MRAAIAYFLFFLVTTSFVVDNNIFYEGEVSELFEKSEKETDKKEKKLLLFGLEMPSLFYDKGITSNRICDGRISLSKVSLDVSTPPPEQV